MKKWIVYTAIATLFCTLVTVCTGCDDKKDGSTENVDYGTTSVSKDDYGTMSVSDIELLLANEAPIYPVFSIEEREEDVEYSFEGDNISIEHGLVKGLVAGTETKVTAKTEHHSATFTVKVKGIEGVLTDKSGKESKVNFIVPNGASEYLLYTELDFEKYRENGYTRTSFAFNGTSASWYNIEMYATGDVYLYASFNGVNKYGILLFNTNDSMLNGKLHFTVAVYVKDGAHCLFVNDKAVCGYSAEEMSGYPTFVSYEVTAAADRDDSGEYKINVSQHYYSTDAAVLDDYENRAMGMS